MIYVLHEPCSGLCQVASLPVLPEIETVLLTAVPGTEDDLLRLRRELGPYHCDGGWYDLNDFNPATLVTSILKALAKQAEEAGFPAFWKARRGREQGEGTCCEMVFSPADFFPPPTPGLEWAHEMYFFSSRKVRMFDVPDEEDFGIYAAGFRTTRKN